MNDKFDPAKRASLPSTDVGVYNGPPNMQILAGQFKGRRLLPPKGGRTTRPITGAVKKSLFAILSGLLPDAVVVDLFCGTGTIGLEALSRGAAVCCFAERDAAALSRLRRNIETVGAAERSIVWAGDVWANLAGRLDRLGGAVDVAFVDPPYALSAAWSWDEAARRLFAPLGVALADEGTVVLRTEASTDLPGRIAELAVQRVKRYGRMQLAFLGLPGRPQRPERRAAARDANYG